MSPTLVVILQTTTAVIAMVTAIVNVAGLFRQKKDPNAKLLRQQAKAMEKSNDQLNATLATVLEQISNRLVAIEAKL